MPKINTFRSRPPLRTDKLVGTDNPDGKTANFTIGAITDFILGSKGDRKFPVRLQVDFTTQEPTAYLEGARYINTVTGIGSSSGTPVVQGYIYEAINAEWVEIAPEIGFTVWDIAQTKNFTYDGTAWTGDYVSETQLDLKADQATTYTESEVDNLLGLKADEDSVYTRTYIDTSLSGKADLATTNTAIATLQAAQSGGLISFVTLADLQAYAGVLTTDSYKVTNDALSSNNGFYHYTGTAFVKDADLVQNVINSANTSEGVSGNAVYQHSRKNEARAIRYRSGKNLLDPSTVSQGSFISPNGNIQANSSYGVSDYISIEAGESLTQSPATDPNVTTQFYDENLAVVHTFPQGALSTVTNTYGAAFARFTVKLSDATPQVEIGSAVTDYEAFNQTKASDLVQVVDNRVTALDEKVLNYENLFDNSATQAGFLSASTGLPAGPTSTSDIITDYIRLSPGQNIAFNSSIRTTSSYSIVQYDVNFNIIDIATLVTSKTLVGVANVHYIRFTVSVALSTAANIVIGTSAPDSYIPRVERINPVFATPTVNSIIQPVSENVTANTSDIAFFNSSYVPAKNLFDKTATLDPAFIPASGTGGFSTGNASYEVTDYIRLDEAQNITISKGGTTGGVFGIYTYDANKNWISTFQTPSTSNTSALITGQANSYYIRLSVLKSSRDTFQIEYGNYSTSYEPYKRVIDQGVLPDRLKQTKKIVLPSKMYMKSNATPSMYLDNFVSAPLKEPKSLYFNGKGKLYERQWNFENKVAGTTSDVVIDYLSDKMEQLYDKQTISIENIDVSSNNGKSVQILAVGDSFTDMGTWVSETKTLLESDGVNVTLQGTMGASGEESENLSGGKMENFLINKYHVSRVCTVSNVTTKPATTFGAVGIYEDGNNTQWRSIGGVLNGGAGQLSFAYVSSTNANPSTEMPASGVLTKVSGTGDSQITYTSWVVGNRNPFYNPATSQAFDFAYYKTRWGFATPDILALQFTYNDIFRYSDRVPAVVGHAKQIIDAFRLEYPTSKVIFSIEPPGARYSLAANVDLFLNPFLEFAKAMKVQFEDNSSYSNFVIIAPSYAFVDLVHGYGTSSNITTPNSARYPNVNYNFGGDGVHPNPTGMQQIADCVVPCVHKLIL
jgi:lysophospholipase L1-like esterase